MALLLLHSQYALRLGSTAGVVVTNLLRRLALCAVEDDAVCIITHIQHFVLAPYSAECKLCLGASGCKLLCKGALLCFPNAAYNAYRRVGEVSTTVWDAYTWEKETTCKGALSLSQHQATRLV